MGANGANANAVFLCVVVDMAMVVNSIAAAYAMGLLLEGRNRGMML